jgi:hypothetical protein
MAPANGSCTQRMQIYNSGQEARESARQRPGGSSHSRAIFTNRRRIQGFHSPAMTCFNGRVKGISSNTTPGFPGGALGRDRRQCKGVRLSSILHMLTIEYQSAETPACMSWSIVIMNPRAFAVVARYSMCGLHGDDVFTAMHLSRPRSMRKTRSSAADLTSRYTTSRHTPPQTADN